MSTPKPIQADCLDAIPGIAHGFFTREGGVSSGVYAHLNCGPGSRDDRACVLENRRRVAAWLGTGPDRLITCSQIHSAEAVCTDVPWALDAMPKADAVVTATPGLAVGALAADCAPVLLADPRAGVVGAAHAGWKGALGGILEATVRAMQGLGSRLQDIHAAVGPCIGPEAYEVGPEFEAVFLAQDPENRRFFSRSAPGERPRFDLPAYALHRLAAAGLGTVENATLCTYRNEDRLFSYRRATHRKEADYGRQVSAIVLR